MKLLLSFLCTLGVAVAAVGDVTLKSVESPFEGGWTPDCWGLYILTFVNDTDKPITVVKTQREYVFKGETLDTSEDHLDTVISPGEEKTLRCYPYLPKELYEKFKPNAVDVVGKAIVEADGAQHEFPFEFKVKGAELAEPLKLVCGKNVGIQFQKSRMENWKNLEEAISWLDECYTTMYELTGNKTRGGKLLIYLETPQIPAYAYASDPIKVNYDGVEKAIEEIEQGIMPFGYVHEMGHVFDYPEYREWYAWNGPCVEFHANFKLAYAYDMLSQQGWHARFSKCPGTGYVAPHGRKYVRMPGSQFLDALFLMFGDAYLADPSRTWETLSSDDYHAFFRRLVRIYGWDPFKRWYRTYGRFIEQGLEPPATAEEEIQLAAAILSYEIGVDLVPIFQRWRMPVTAEDVQKMMERYPIGKGDQLPIDPKDVFTSDR